MYIYIYILICGNYRGSCVTGYLDVTPNATKHAVRNLSGGSPNNIKSMSPRALKIPKHVQVNLNINNRNMNINIILIFILILILIFSIHIKYSYEYSPYLFWLTTPPYRGPREHPANRYGAN